MKELEILLNKRWVLKSRDKETYYKLRDALGELRKFTTEKMGCQIIDNSLLIKMEKIPVIPESFMGIQKFSSKEEYAYLCILLMFLEDKDAQEQFIISQLTEYITANLPGEISDWTLYTNRRKLIRVMRFAADQGTALKIPTSSNRVDIGVRVELPYEVFAHLTDELYESKIVYRTEKFQDRVRTFCMNPKGVVVNENTNGIVTVNGHSYEDPALHTENTNFALLVAKHFSEPFKDSNGYGESIARLSNMLGGGVIVQRFGDLIRGQRSTPKRVEESFVTPTLAATPGDLSLVMPKRILDGIIEMIYALDKIAPGTANDDTLLYGVEVKFYNMEVQLDENLETPHKGLFVIGDGSGVTHSLSHASASGVYVARHIAESL